MREKTTNPKRVKGTVLFTVVAVMMVLTVFLAATLALATTANRRAYTNYQQEQSEYTARAVLEAVTQQVQTDAAADGSGICTQICDVLPNTSTSIPVTIDDGTTSETHEVIVTNTNSTQSMYDATLGAFRDYPVYQLSVTVDSATTNASATYETYLALEVTSDTPTPPTTPPTPSGGGGGAFVSLGGVSARPVGTHGYTTGGSYIGIGGPGPLGPITDPNDKTNAVLLAAADKQTIDAPLYINNNASVTNDFYIHFTKPDDFMVVTGDLYVTNPKFHTDFTGYIDTGATYENTPYIYIGGALRIQQEMVVGDDTHPVNMYVGNMQYVGKKGLDLHGDLYLMDEDATSNLNVDESPGYYLHEWVGATLNRAEGYSTRYGNIYAMGSVSVTGTNNTMFVDGNVQINKDLTVSKLKVTGDVIVNGTLTVTNSLEVGEKVIAGTIVGGDKIHNATSVSAVTGGTTTIDASTLPAQPTHNYKTWYENVVYDKSSDEQFGWGNVWFKARYELHQVIDGVEQPVKTVPNEWEFEDIIPYQSGVNTAGAANIDEYAGATNAKAKALLENVGEANASVEDRAAGYDFSNSIYFDRDVYPQNYTREKLNDSDPAVGKIEQPQPANYESMYPVSITALDSSLFDGGAYQVPIYGANGNATYPTVINGGDALPLSDLETSDYYKITSSCVLTGSIDKNVYVDSSSGSVTVIIDKTWFEYGDNGTSGLIIDDTSNVTIFVVGNNTFNNGAGIITKDYLELIWNASPVDLSARRRYVFGEMQQDITIAQEQTPGSPTYPNVVIYSDDGANLAVNDGGVVTAMVRAPKLKFSPRQGSSASRTIHYVLPTGETVDYGYNCEISSCNNCIGVIGQLIAGEIDFGDSGNWGMLYITEPASSTPPTTPPTTPTTPPTTPTPGSTHATLGVLYSNVY